MPPPIPRADIANAFKHALKHLSPTANDTETTHEYICHALMYTSAGTCFNFHAASAARDIITERLNDQHTVESWLYYNLTSDQYDIVTQDRRDGKGRKVQAYRKAWLKSLIAEFSLPS